MVYNLSTGLQAEPDGTAQLVESFWTYSLYKCDSSSCLLQTEEPKLYFRFGRVCAQKKIQRSQIYEIQHQTPASHDMEVGKKKARQPYQCTICTSEFTASGSLKAHMNAHYGVKPYKCSECGATFTQGHSLKSHKLIHSGDRPYKCDQCDVAFTQMSSLKAHIRSHTGETPYKCEQCEYRSATQGGLRTHIANKHDRTNTNIPCPSCPKHFGTQLKLNAHLRYVHKVADLPCDICGLLFKVRSHLMRHKRESHVKDKLYSCDSCPTKLKSKNSLRSHILGHIGNPYHCSKCNSSFASLSLHKFHMASVHTKLPSTCEKCGKTYKNKSNLAKHKLSVHGERVLSRKSRFQCDICPQVLFSKYALGVHKENHQCVNTGHDCEICGKTFKLSKELQQHLQTHRLPEEQQNDITPGASAESVALRRVVVEEIRLFECEVCGMKLRKKSLKQHMKLHDDNRPYKCDQCPKVFALKQSFDKHVFSHSGEKPYKCSQCLKRYQAVNSLNYHMRKHHK